MYTPYREEGGIDFKIPWDTNTAKGFGVSLLLYLLFLFVGGHIEIEKAKPRVVEVNRIPIEIINFGDGDGTGMSKGNLTEEGMMHKGDVPATNFSDAEIAGKTQATKNLSNVNPEDATSFTPTKDIAASSTHDGSATASGTRNVGAPNGSLSGTGLGDKGFGKGAGLGLGDIEWGGGGNRTVLSKRAPLYPKGAKAGQVKIRFVVDKSGTVVSMRPVQRGGEPLLEKAAMEALRMWKFNPLKEDKNMEGVISFIFRLK